MIRMYRACIAIIDASRARLFTFERDLEPEGLHESFKEETDLVDPARRLRPSELFSDSRPGVGRTGSLQYGVDDHREAHIEQFDIVFARNIVAEIKKILGTKQIQRLVVCGSPNMLGVLRTEMADLRRDPLVIEEIPRDLVKLTLPQIRDQLTDYGLLPPRPPRPPLSPVA
ncbi:MAG: Host attachment protein [Deltaproteobacteria bacterium]|nr:Host attachment protein [Deltaproteobacteria bacterium]